MKSKKKSTSKIVQQPAAQLGLPRGYAKLLEELKKKIRLASVKAALAANQEMVLLYWHIGKSILDRQRKEEWGAKVIDRLSKDLTSSFPDMKGFYLAISNT